MALLHTEITGNTGTAPSSLGQSLLFFASRQQVGHAYCLSEWQQHWADGCNKQRDLPLGKQHMHQN